LVDVSDPLSKWAIQNNNTCGISGFKKDEEFCRNDLNHPPTAVGGILDPPA
jgi:hypothetical protein